MKKQTDKNSTPKMIPLTTPQAKSVDRMRRMSKVIFDAITKEANAITKEKETGDVTINEIINVLTKISLSYNMRGLEAQHKQFQQEKK